MTKQEDYSTRVADLIQEAFQNLGDAIALPAGTDREARAALAEQAHLRVEAAQAIATMGHARETRIQTLLTVATAAPADGAALNPGLVGEAYAAALTMLGLIEEDPEVDAARMEELREALGLKDDDATDAALGDLP